MLGLPRLNLAHLERPFTEEEVEGVIKLMPQDKASGPDGFTGRFYATCWSIIKEDFMSAIGCFYSGDMRGLSSGGFISQWGWLVLADQPMMHHEQLASKDDQS